MKTKQKTCAQAKRVINRVIEEEDEEVNEKITHYRNSKGKQK